MKLALKLALLLLCISLGQSVAARTVEIDVYGMTCAFCVNSLKRNFEQMNSVSKVEVSLKLKKVRLETQESEPNLEQLKKMVLDAGFTPTKITVLPNENN